ncbi:MAG: enoyl-CoA hydratase/isomerase family protein [Rhizobiaceae bacterium]|nr:enoyl-CoA hydratase/isomerase family protein [Rhizobiaceae bacterium]
MDTEKQEAGVVVAERRGARLTLTINRPQQRNALTREVLAALRDGLARAKADGDVRAVVLTGAGEKAFCAGGDIGQMGAGETHSLAAHEARGELAALFRDLWELGKPTIARVQGHALAGGFGLAVACDFVVAGESATFGLPEIGVGIWPYMVTVPLLISMQPRQVLRLMLTGERVSAAEGRALGFVTEVAPADRLDAAVDALVEKLAKAAPHAVALGRTAFYSVVNHDVEAKLKMLQAMLSVNLALPEAQAAMAAFMAKRG